MRVQMDELTFFDLPIGAQACLAAMWLIIELGCVIGFVYSGKKWLDCRDAEEAACSAMLLFVGLALSAVAFLIIG